MRRLRREDGTISVLTLAIIGLLFVPMISVLILTSRMTNASTQAAGMAFNLAYGAENRAVDVCATNNSSAGIQLKTDDSIDPSCNQNTTLHDITVDMQAISDYQARLAQNTSGGSGVQFTQAQPVQIFNVGYDPISARCMASSQPIPCSPALTSTCNTGPSTALSSGGASYCWRDGRHFDSGGAFDYAFDHFSSGTQAQVTYRLPAPGGTWLQGTQTGVATFGRPCQAGHTDCAQ